MARKFTADDEGKTVVTADGDMVGTVESVSGSMARVTPDENLSRGIRRRLGWSEDGEDAYELPQSKVESITDDEIQLTESL